MTEPLTVTRITHSCHLIQIGPQTVLTDPWFSERALYHPRRAGRYLARRAAGPGRGRDLPPPLRSLRPRSALRLPRQERANAGRRAGRPPGTRRRIHQRPRAGPRQSAAVKDLTVTAAPGKHGVPEVTFVIAGGGRSVYFAGDTMLIPELRTLPDRFPRFDVALLPVNGLRIRPQFNKQVVMNAEQAAELTAALQPHLTVPHHYAFTSGWLGDRLLTKGDRDPRRFTDAASRIAPGAAIRILQPASRSP